MNENVIEFLRDQKVATLTLSQKRLIKRVKQLAQKFPEDCKIIKENDDGSIYAHIPVKWIKINSSQRQRKEMSDEEREVMKERLEKARQKRKEKQNEKQKLL